MSNVKPTVTRPIPAQGIEGVPIKATELVFTLADDDGDLMEYTAEKSIGVTAISTDSSPRSNPGGKYIVPLTDLKYDTFYKMTVTVSDGKEETKQVFTFRTEKKP